MKKIIISSLLAANLFANQCTIFAKQVSILYGTEVEYLVNGLDTQFCANYEMTLSLLIAAKNICRNDPGLYDAINEAFEELNQVDYKIKCKLKGYEQIQFFTIKRGVKMNYNFNVEIATRIGVDEASKFEII